MNVKSISSVALAIAALLSFTAAAQAGPDRSNMPAGYQTVVKTKADVMKCCLPGEKVALACKDCKTINEKKGDDKKDILAWFKPDSTHDCSGCGGKITYKAQEGKGTGQATYKHVCSKCGPESAYSCATHKA
jgi:hypothetical protein